MKGFINVYKPEGISSATVVGIIKKKYHTPCGHMGTLDPMAEGVLPVGLNKTSRLFPYLLNKKKTYVADFTFGTTTDTLDVTGTVLESGKYIPTFEEIESVIPEFIGEILQMPPKYSAKCVNGKRGYQLARKGIDFELEPKRIVVYKIEIIEKVNEFTYRFNIECSGGTYIRSICRDVAQRLNTVAVMSKLVRTQSGGFSIDSAVSLESIKSASDEEKEKYVIPSDYPLNFEKLTLTERQAERILNGVFEDYGFKDGEYSVYLKDEFWGVGKVEKGVLKIKSYVRENS